MFWRACAVTCAAMVVFSGCDGDDISTPEGTVRAFFESCKKGDSKDFRAYFTKPAQKMFEAEQKLWEKKGGAKKESDLVPQFSRYEIKETKADGDAARVTVSVTEMRNGKEVTEGQAIIALRRQNGAWKIFGFGASGGEVMNFEEEAPKVEAMLKAFDATNQMPQAAPEPTVPPQTTTPLTTPPQGLPPELERQLKEAMEKAKTDVEKAQGEAKPPKETEDALKRMLQGANK